VHHRTTAVAKMNGTTRTRLSDLQCLCANCHRLVHREAL
jgi:5-methylcytosine-specific restriction protein A